MRRRTRDASTDAAARRRAQTTIDFAVGVGIFLVTVSFVLAFVPGMLQPFEQGNPEQTVATDRIATSLVNDVLTDPTSPNVLDVHCTEAFFDSGLSSAACNFDNGESLEERVAAPEFSNVMVELIGDADGDDASATLCIDVDGYVVEDGDANCQTVLEIGDEPPTDTGSVVVGRRSASIGGVDGWLLVRMW